MCFPGRFLQTYRQGSAVSEPVSPQPQIASEDVKRRFQVNDTHQRSNPIITNQRSERKIPNARSQKESSQTKISNGRSKMKGPIWQNGRSQARDNTNYPKHQRQSYRTEVNTRKQMSQLNRSNATILNEQAETKCFNQDHKKILCQNPNLSSQTKSPNENPQRA